MGRVVSVGKAGTVQQRSEMNGNTYQQVLDFRLERWAPSGEALPPIPVELRCYTMRGTVVAGDQVEVTGTMTREGLLRASKVRNLNTNLTIASDGGKRRVVAIIALVVVLGWIAFVATLIIHSAVSGS